MRSQYEVGVRKTRYEFKILEVESKDFDIQTDVMLSRQRALQRTPIHRRVAHLSSEVITELCRFTFAT